MTLKNINERGRRNDRRFGARSSTKASNQWPQINVSVGDESDHSGETWKKPVVDVTGMTFTSNGYNFSVTISTYRLVVPK